MTEVTVATKIGSEELKRIDAIVRRRGLLNRSDFVKEAIWLYLSLASLETEARLRNAPSHQRERLGSQGSQLTNLSRKLGSRKTSKVVF